MTDNIVVLEYGTPETLRGDQGDGARRSPRCSSSRCRAAAPSCSRASSCTSCARSPRESDTALIFDEVVTGFRCHPGGAQALFGVRADIATYGKVIGGGLPIGVVAGSAKYLDALDGGTWHYGDESVPEVGVTFFAGTFVRHPLALAAARAVLLRLKEEGPELQREPQPAHDKLRGGAERARGEGSARRYRSIISRPGSTSTSRTICRSRVCSFAIMRDKGVHIWEGRPCFLTLAHTDADLDRIVTAFSETLAEMQAADFPARGRRATAHPKCAQGPRPVGEAGLVCCRSESSGEISAGRRRGRSR